MMELLTKIKMAFSREVFSQESSIVGVCQSPECASSHLAYISHFELSKDQYSHHIETSQLICIANQLTGF